MVNGLIYVFGGGGPTAALTSTEAYDPATDTWTVKAPLPTGRSYTAAATLRGLVYVVGGNYNTSLSAVEAYDPATNSWLTRPSLPFPREDHALAASDDTIYAIGGYSSAIGGYTASVESFTPAVAPTLSFGFGSLPSAQGWEYIGSISESSAFSATWRLYVDGLLVGTGSSRLRFGATPEINLYFGDITNGPNARGEWTQLAFDQPTVVADTTPPVIAVPANLTLEATGPGGATATFAASAIDNVDGSVPVTLSPASGSTFVIRVTTVTLTATDATGNSSTKTFTVTVLSPAQQIDALAALVNALSTLSASDRSALTAKLNSAASSLAKGNPNAASGQLGAFANQVSAFVNSKRLTAAQAQPLLDAVNRIIGQLH